MVADIDLADVEDGEVVVAGEVVADEDVFASVAVEGLGNPHTLAHSAKHLLQVTVLGQIVAPVDGVEDLALPNGLGLEGDQFLVGIRILYSCVTFFQIRHSIIFESAICTLHTSHFQCSCRHIPY